jgi:integrase
MSTVPKPAPTVTVADALEALLEQTDQRVRDDVRSPATLSMQVAHARWWMRELGADTPLEAVTEFELERIASRPRVIPKHGRPPAGPATLRKRLSTLRAALELAHRRRKVSRVPAFPKMLVRPPPATNVLTRYDDARRLFDSLPLHRAEWFWLALWTGQHASDVERMTWKDVDLDSPRPTMLIRNWKNRRRVGLRVLMPGPLVEVLQAKRDRERPGSAAPIVRPWPSRKTTLPAHCRRVGLPVLNATALRHTNLTWVVRRLGITPAACAWAGHSSPEQMARRYAHALPPQIREVTEALNSIVDEGAVAPSEPEPGGEPPAGG